MPCENIQFSHSATTMNNDDDYDYDDDDDDDDLKKNRPKFEIVYKKACRVDIYKNIYFFL